MGSEFITEMQRQFRLCVALGTISLGEAVQLYGDWLTQTTNNTPQSYT